MTNYLTDTLKGKYTVRFPEKYIGLKPPIYRSSWELKFFDALDNNPNVLKWGSECLEIPYYNVVKRSQSIYLPDIFCTLRQTSGEMKQFLVEIKPFKMCARPNNPKPPKIVTAKTLAKYEKAKKRHESDLATYLVNAYKWEAAMAWCNRHRVTFIQATEQNVASFLK